jgi:hypothetical protein
VSPYQDLRLGSAVLEEQQALDPFWIPSASLQELMDDEVARTKIVVE